MSRDVARILLALAPAYMYGVWLYQEARDARRDDE